MIQIQEFTINTALGKPKSLADFRGKVLLIVNTASRCGCTPQYVELQYLYEKYRHLGLEILDFPTNQFGQTPESALEYMRTCRAKFGTKFTIFEKIDVNGEHAHPLFVELKKAKPYDAVDNKDTDFFAQLSALGFQYPTAVGDIRWNFTKFLFNRKGILIERYSPATTPLKLESVIVSLLKS